MTKSESRSVWPTGSGQGLARWGGELDGLPEKVAWLYDEPDTCPALFGRLVMMSGLAVFLDQTPGITALRLSDGAVVWHFRQPDNTEVLSVTATSDIVVSDRWVISLEDGRLLQSLADHAGDVALGEALVFPIGKDLLRVVNIVEARGRHFWIDGVSGDVSICELPFSWGSGLGESNTILGYEGKPPVMTLKAIDGRSGDLVWSVDDVDIGAPLHFCDGYLAIAGGTNVTLIAENGNVVFSESYEKCTPEIDVSEPIQRPNLGMAPGRVFVYRRRVLICLSAASGERLWDCTFDGQIDALCAAGSYVFVATNEYVVRALSVKTGEVAWQTETGGQVASLQASGDRLVVVRHHGEIIAFACEA